MQAQGESETGLPGVTGDLRTVTPLLNDVSQVQNSLFSAQSQAQSTSVAEYGTGYGVFYSVMTPLRPRPLQPHIEDHSGLTTKRSLGEQDGMVEQSSPRRQALGDPIKGMLN